MSDSTASSSTDISARAHGFVEKWSRVELTERAASHEHFIDLCNLLEQPTPASADATGEDYCFEKHVKVVRSASKGSKGLHGFVDVWWRGKFAWEYKQKGKYSDLDEAYRQLYQYRDDLDNPPLSITCDIKTIEVRTHFPSYPTTKETIRLEEIPAKLGRLRWIFTDPDQFRKTQKTTETVTKELAKEFGDLADSLIARYPPDDLALWESAGSPVAHFLMKVMFCLFAEDIGLLPDQAFTKLINLCLFHPEQFQEEGTKLFALMRTGGRFGFDTIPWFNGGLFDEAPALPLNARDLNVLRRVAGDEQNWAGVEPSIFGTLFERILDPKKRAQIGAHYTSKSDILLVVDPVVMQPLRRRWKEVQDQLATAIEKHDAEPDRKKRGVLAAPITVIVTGFRKFLADQRILDPACGSGNFLYVALQQLLDLDEEVVRFAKRRDIDLDPIPYIRPTQLHGIEINPYAAELAQVVIWIGYLQWMHIRLIENPKRPILDKLQTIEHRDAILDLRDKKNPKPAEWPEADFIVGNPPFLGGSQIWEGLGTDYRNKLWKTFDIPGTSDLCCYWFELARRAMTLKEHVRAGLLATQGIRGTANREVLSRIKSTGDIFLAWSDRNWTLEGAAVHVSIIAFDRGVERDRSLDGRPVDEIFANLQSSIDLTDAKPIDENRRIVFIGTKRAGPFDIDWGTAAKWLRLPRNPNGTQNADVLRPWVNAQMTTSRLAPKWIIDFDQRPLVSAAGYEAPFKYAEEHVLPDRLTNKEERAVRLWWHHRRPAMDMKAAVGNLARYLSTPRHAKHRLFIWLERGTQADDGIYVFARQDDYFCGVLSSSIHELWARRSGTQVREAESGFRYTPQTCFDNFPFPWPSGREDVNHPAYARISAAAKALNDHRERWLNPPEWLDPIAERIDAQDTFADIPSAARPLIRRSAIMAAAAKDSRLKKRTLTNLYNERPTWLKLAHDQLDRAVLAAYDAVNSDGKWDEDWAEMWVDVGAGQNLAEETGGGMERAKVNQDVLGNLLRLNLRRTPEL